MDYRLLTFMSETGPRAGMLVGERIYDVAHETAVSSWSTVLGILEHWGMAESALEEAARRIEAGAARSAGQPLEQDLLLAPVLHPGTIYCAGANYSDHREEMARALGLEPTPDMKELGEAPWHFIKTGRSSVVGPNAAVKLPAYSKTVDWEIELAVVIGKPAKDVPVEKALEYVAGYTIANDLSARDAMRRSKMPPTSPFHLDWIGHKSFDGSCPIGPWIVPASQIADPHRLALKLWVSGELMQDSNTEKLIFDVPEQISMLSSRVTLQPGDMILTGTPAGTGAPQKRFLRSGETVRLSIEGIGEFEHSMV